jgi:hypothetical protein
VTLCGRAAHEVPFPGKRECDPKNCPAGFKSDPKQPGSTCFYMAVR